MSWKYYLPDGSFYTLPDDITRDMADDQARRKHPELFTPRESTITGALAHGAKSLVSEGQELLEIPFKGVDVAAERAARRERELTEKYGTGASFEDVSKKYEDEGILSAAGEVARQSAMALAGGAPYMAEIAAGALAGPVGLAAAAYAPRLASNIERQASLQREKGKPVDVDVAEAAGYAVPEAALDIAAQAIPLGRTAAGKIFGPEVEKLLSMGEKTAAEEAAKDAIVAQRGLWKSAGRGVAKNLAAQELIQPVLMALDRLQTDQDLVSDEALAQYGEAMYTAAIMSPLGAVEGVTERSAAKSRIAERTLRAEEEKPGIDEATGQETLAPELFKYEAEGADEKSRFGRIRAEMEKALKRKLTDEEVETLRTEVEGKQPEAETEAPEEVGPPPQMGLELRPQQMEEQRDLFGGEEPKQPGTQLDLFAEPEERGEAPVYTREQAVRELTQRLEETEGRAPTKEELAEAYESAPAAQPDTSQMEMLFTGIQESLGLEEPTAPKPYDLEAEAQQRAVEEPITARNQVEREAARKIELEKYIGENEGQMPLPFDDIGGKRPEETTPVEAPAEQSPEQIAKAKAIEAIIGADKATIQLVKDATGYSSAKAKNLLDQLTAEGVLAKPDATTARKVLMPVKQLEMKLDELLPARTPSAGEQIEMFSPEETYGKKPFTIKDLSDEQLADIYGSKQPEGTARYKEALPRSEWEKEAPPIEPKRFEERLEDTATTTPHSGQEWLPGTEPKWQHLYDTEAEAQQRAAGEALAQRKVEEPVNVPNVETNTEATAGTVVSKRLNKRRVPTSDEQPVQPRGTGEPSTEAVGGERLDVNKPDITEPTERAGERPAPLDTTELNRQKTQQSEAAIRSQAANDLQEQLDELIDELHPKKIDRIQDAINQVRRGTRTYAEVSHLLAKTTEAPKLEAPIGRPIAVETPKVEAPAPKKVTPTMDDLLAKIEGYRKASTEPKTQLGETTGGGVDIETARTVAHGVASNWKNAPIINVVKSIADLPDHLQNVDPRAKGLYDPTAKMVHIIADNADVTNPHASIKATVFHESLGHFGLERAFGDGLDALLTNLHKTNKTVQERANAWLKRNPEAYKNSADRTARAVEEVFAEMSERGELEKAPTGLHLAFTKVVDFISNFLERMGLKQKDYTKADKREIFDTLRRAHESVTGEREAAVAERSGKGEIRYDKPDYLNTNFRKWFGSSKIVDEYGDPRPMYHGTTADIKTFKRGTKYSKAIFLTPAPFVADKFAKFDKNYMPNTLTGSSLYKVYARAEKPFDYENDAHIKDVVQNMSESDLHILASRDSVTTHAYTGNSVGEMTRNVMEKLSMGDWKTIEYDTTQRILHKLGYDGFYVQEHGIKNLAVYDPHQIKSATGNSGEFSRDNPDIRYQLQSEGIIEDDIPLDSGTGRAAENARRVQAARASGDPKKELERYGDADLHMVSLDPSRKAKALDVLSGANSVLKSAVQDVLSIHHKAQLYGDKLPSLYVMDNRVNARGAELRTRQKVLSEQLKGWMKTLSDKRYSKATLNNFYDIALRSTLDQVELLNDKGRGRTREEGSLARRFDALPKELQTMYKDMRDGYEAFMHEYVDLVAKSLPKNEVAAFRKEFEQTRLKVYLPLFREGKFWIAYTDKAGNPVKSSFVTEYRRNTEVAKLKASGIKNIDTYLNVQQLRESGQPPTGFLGTILKTLKDQGITDPKVLDSMYEAFLDYLPASSLRQRFRPRENYLGMEGDLINTYANVADNMVRMINNMKHVNGIEEAMSKLYEEASTGKNRSNEALSRTVASIQKQMDFIRNPRIAKWASAGGYASYMWYLAGNASSAIVNLSHVPMVVYPMLGGKHGYGASAAALKKASSVIKLQWGDEPPKGYEALYKAAHEAGALGIHPEQELFDLKRTKATDYTGKMAKVKKGMDYMFRVTDKVNREAALVAAYELELKKNNGNVSAAHKAAIELVKESYGSALTEAGPRIMQNNAAKVFLTFKGFAINRAFILGKAMRDAFAGESKEVRSIARRQVIGINAMALAFTGVAGMPLVGMLEFIANQCMGDEDDPFDAESEVRTAVGDLMYKGPFAHFLNLAVSERMGWNDMIWKDDPRKLADVGIVDYILGQSLGPVYNIVSQVGDAYDYYKQGKYDRMFESMTPVAIRNVAKAVRYGLQGAQTVNGKPIGEVGIYNAIMQGAGFGPEDINRKRQQATSMSVQQTKITNRRRALIDQAEGAYRRGNSADILDIEEDIDAFNNAHPDYEITTETITTAIKNSIKQEESSVFGINLNKHLATELFAEQGLDEYGNPLE